jgi:hypothetical protein
MKTFACLTCAAIVVLTSLASAQQPPLPAGMGPGDPKHIALYEMPKAPLETRWYTFENQKGLKGEGGKERFGRKGAPATALPAGKELVLADVQGSGTVRRIWMTLFNRDPVALRGLKIVCTWDGADAPAVQAPLGDFFCQALGHMTAFENACFSSPEARSFDCIVPMPFRKSARVSLVNESGNDNGVYYEVDCTLGDRHDENAMYFHSYWRRENMTTVREDMTILPRVEGRGRFLGCSIGVREHPSMTNFWWGEGEVKVYLDGDAEHATLVGTGTEDYAGSGYGLGFFAHQYQGCQYVSEKKDAFGFYRLHIPDPVYFQKDCRATIQVMGGPSYAQMLEALKKDPSLRFMKAGKGGEYYTREELEKDTKRAEVMERIDDYSATAWWYMDKPTNGLPPLAAPAERMKDLP